ncbi:MAG TPA: nicotinamide-nucleotide amidohydrolase family protein [Bacteriovoracaceae bacterium]|nr:nicotinamide-nucleotide amidohydrolase family protein [Bacteriovoracaceae bacterium]
MKVGLLIIATEILEGKILDLNGKFLSDFLALEQLELHSSLTVRDNEVEIHRGLDFLLKTCDVIVTSGGLGPTKDDLTKEALTTYLGRTNAYSKEAHSVAEENYQRLGRSFPGDEHVYCFLPMGFVALSNSTGFAPGLFCEHLGKFIISAPGVPREFRSILNDHLKPWIQENYNPDLLMENVIIRTKKVPEEKIFGELDPSLWDKLTAIGDVSSLPALMGVDIGVKIKAHTKKELDQKKASVMKIIDDSPVKFSVWHYGPEKLEEIIVALANKKNITYGFAESCTGGFCSHRITGIPGSSKTFLGSVVSYDPEVKKNTLKVNQSTMETHGIVSKETAMEMAIGLTKEIGVNLAVSTTGVAGPSGGSPEIPVGTVCIALVGPGISTVTTYNFTGNREVLKERFTQAALLTLLEGLAQTGPI